MKTYTEHFISRKELIEMIKKEVGIDINEESVKLSSIGIKFRE